MGQEPQLLIFLSLHSCCRRMRGKVVAIERQLLLSLPNCRVNILLLICLSALQRKTNSESKSESCSFIANCHPFIALWQSVCKQRAICNDGIFCSERKWKLFLQLLNCSVTNSLLTICLLHNLHIHEDFSLKLGIFTSASARLIFSVL